MGKGGNMDANKLEDRHSNIMLGTAIVTGQLVGPFCVFMLRDNLLGAALLAVVIWCAILYALSVILDRIRRNALKRAADKCINSGNKFPDSPMF